MGVRFLSCDQGFVDQVRAGGPDAYGLPAERVVSDGGKPVPVLSGSCARGGGDADPSGAAVSGDAALCRDGADLSLCSDHCKAWTGAGVPPVLTTSPDYLLKGYSGENRIVDGTSRIVAKHEIVARAEEVFADPRVDYVDVRSARNNCFQTRIVRAS